MVAGAIHFCVVWVLSTDSLPFPPAPSSTSSPNCHSPCRPGLSTLVSGVATQAFSLCLTLTKLVSCAFQTGSSPSVNGSPDTLHSPWPFFSPPHHSRLKYHLLRSLLPSPCPKEPILCPVPLPCLLLFTGSITTKIVLLVSLLVYCLFSLIGVEVPFLSFFPVC